MSEPRPYVTDHDLLRLKQAINAMRRIPRRSGTEAAQLESMLARCGPIASDQVPSDIITLYTDIQLLDLGSDSLTGCTLVLPEEADGALFKVSVLAPLGLALLGHGVCDVVE